MNPRLRQNGVTRAITQLALCALLAGAPLAASAAGAFELTTPGVADNGTLDVVHSASANNCGGGNISPALQWRNAPAGTKSYAVTIYDPDGAKGLGIVHWIIYGIAPNVTELGAGAALPPGTVSGTNRTGGPGYYGPCPPVGDLPHHYVVQVYALDLPTDALAPGLTRDAMLAALKDHVLASASTVLRFGR